MIVISRALIRAKSIVSIVRLISIGKVFGLFLSCGFLFGVYCHQALAQSNAGSAQDATSESSRERDRVLLKRSPIASEYQSLSAPGEVLGANFDAEGVDFRSNFRLRKGRASTSIVKAETIVNYQSIAQELKLGGSVYAARSFGNLSLQIQGQRNSSDRLVDLYQSRWLLDSKNTANEVLTLGYPRYTQDGIQTQSIDMRWRADYKVNDELLLSYEGLNTNYDDLASRNRFEIQFGAGELSGSILNSDGSTIDQARVSDARIRRYFHRLNTARDINRHKLGFILDRKSSSLEFSTYYSRWINDRLWLPWNFIESDVSASYKLDNRYLPSVDVTNSNIVDVTNAVFSNYRIAKSLTKDTDYAFLLNWDKKFDVANHELWLEIGAAWRSKERAVNNDRAVYGATNNTFTLDALTGNNVATSIIDNGFLLPAGIENNKGETYFTHNLAEQFEINLSQSFLESIQDIYTSKEIVNSLYFNAYQQRHNWFWRAGLRFEQTQTSTRGAVYDSPDSDIASQGLAITSVLINGETIAESFDSFDAAFVKGSNNYQHLLPSVELRYQFNKSLLFKTAYFQQLMRPQYFDTVSYRRTNVATLSITEGNPDLAATRIENLYFGIDFQYSESGQLVAGLYYNSVSDFFYDSNSSELIGEDLYEVASVENGKDGVIKGLQAYWLHDFSLPVFSQSEIQLAYTYSDSEGNLVDRAISMPERAEHRIAINLLMVLDDWQYRSQFSWQSEAIDDVGASAVQDTIREDVLVWNQTISWQFNSKIVARMSINNILDSPERSYQGQKNRVLNNLYSGSNARLSIAMSF